MPTQSRRVRVELADRMLKPRFVDGQELPNWREGSTIGDYIRQLFDEEWHLTRGDGSDRELVFERQVP